MPHGGMSCHLFYDVVPSFIKHLSKNLPQKGHLGERNCTSTAPKLSKTSAVSTPHPWHMCHFEGTDRSFALQVSALALLGREAEARAALAVLQELQPDVTITRNKEDRGYRIATPAFHRL